MKNRLVLIGLFVGFLGWHTVGWSQVKRSRGESMPTFIGANTIGFGNLWGEIETSLREDRGFIKLEPMVWGEIGLSEVMALKAGMFPFETGLIGKTNVQLKLTLPRNDNLRAFGLAAVGQLFLSTEEDTISPAQDEERPKFSPEIGFTGIMDYDLVKVFPRFPLKFYANVTTLDYDRLLPVFTQIAIKGGLEFKEPLWSVFGTTRWALYKTKLTKYTKEGSQFDHRAFILGGGFRYRQLRIWKIPVKSFSGVLYMEKRLFATWPTSPRLDFTYPDFKISINLYWSPFFRETQAEAIRNTILSERFKKRKNPIAGLDPVSNAPQENEVNPFLNLKINRDQKGPMVPGYWGEEDELLKKQNEIKNRRKRIHEELEKIEELIE